MTYREKLEQYKKGKLEEEERKRVEKDIERQDAISEFLADRLEEEMKWEIGKTEEELPSNRNFHEESEERAFERYVKKSVARSFRRVGICIGAVLAAILLFIQLGLSPLVASFYYNPKDGEKIDGLNSADNKENQMSIDLSVYTELSLPCKKREAVEVSDKGYGIYDITIRQTVSYNRSFHNVSGKVRRGTLELYDPNLLQEPTSNAFGCYGLALKPTLDRTYLEQAGNRIQWAGGQLFEADELVDELDEKEYYYGYVTFQKDLDFNQVKELMARLEEKEEIWFGFQWMGVRTADDNYFTDGFFGYESQFSGNLIRGWDMEKYPELFLWTQETADKESIDDLEEKLKDENTMTEHFKSLLRYMADQKRFLKMMGKTAKEYEQAFHYVEEHGLSFYGFAAVMNKKTMQELLKEEEILCIYPVQYE